MKDGVWGQGMELPHEAYFYTLATVGITFAGFASILMALRQGEAPVRAREPNDPVDRSEGTSAASLGERPARGMSRFHLWVAKSYIQSGLFTAMCALLGPLLFALGLSQDMTWRVASLLIGFPSLAMLTTAPRQWRAASQMPVPLRVWIQIAIGVIVNLLLLFNAAGWPWPPQGGLVMLAVSWNLFAFFLQFAESVNFFFEDERNPP